MSVLSVLGQTAGVLGAAYKGYGEDQELGVKRTMAKQAAERQAANDAVTNALHAATTRKTNADTADLEDTGGYAGHTVDKNGQTWIITKRGTLRPAVAGDPPTDGASREATGGIPSNLAPANMTAALQGVPATVAKTTAPARRPSVTPATAPAQPKFGNVDPNSADGIAAAEKKRLEAYNQTAQRVQSTDPATGKTIWTWLKPGQEASAPAKAGTTAASGAQVPVADMEDRMKEVEAHAAALGRGEWHITQPMQVREGTEYGTAHDAASGNVSPTKLATQGVLSVVDAGGEDYPKYQAMMNSYRALGDDVAKVFKGRQNEEAVLREVALAQLTPQDYQNPASVAQKLSRLRNVIALAKLSNPAQAPLSHASTAPAVDVDAIMARYPATKKP